MPFRVTERSTAPVPEVFSAKNAPYGELLTRVGGEMEPPCIKLDIPGGGFLFFIFSTSLALFSPADGYKWKLAPKGSTVTLTQQ